ncbi:MAG: phosphotransferase family protein [Acidimicrobiia bacterium]
MSRTPPRIAATVDELVAGATSRVVVTPGDARSGSTFEQVELGGRRYFLKQLGYRSDWIMRVTGDRDVRTFKIWQAGLMDRAPSCIDHAVVGMAVEGEGEDALLAVLMRDIGAGLVPEGDDLIPVALHRQLVDHLAALSAAFWGWSDDIGLCTMAERLRFFAPDNIAPELGRPDVSATLLVARDGWAALEEKSPALHALATSIHADPEPLVDALAATPSTFLQGDWKMGNLGSHPDGRTILLDWAYPGAGPACWDFAWYLALNRARLPESKEVTVDTFRAALDRYGIDTSDWFDTQLELCLLGMMATFGWEKALGDESELRWWEAAAQRGARHLDGGS